jgi:hypothetical protein
MPEIDLCDPELLIFDEDPGLFVLLDQTPIVFTMRGLRFFCPRLKWIGIDIGTLQTADQFKQATSALTIAEYTELKTSIEASAGATHAPNEHQVLLAALSGDIDAAEAAMARLDHSRRAGLSVVR